MELNGRMKVIANKVPKCNVVCDIGTDHAYLPIYLIEKQVCKKAVASDINMGPLKSAKENIEKYNFNEVIEIRLGNGLESISEDEADVIIIAGLGGILITEILAKEINKAQKANTIILQPMSSIDILRQWLYENCFNICDEELSMEDEKIYHILSVRWEGEINKKEVNEIYYYIGEKLVEKKDPLLEKYINTKLRHLKKAICELEKADKSSDGVKEKYIWMRDEFIKILNKI